MNFHNFNWLDYAIVAIIAVSSLISLMRGFIREALSLASWIIAFWVALSFNSNFGDLLKPYIAHDTLRIAIAFFILFIVTLFVGSLVNYLITSLVEKTGLSGTDRLLGIFFGFARGVLLVAIVLLAAQVSSLPQTPVWRQSQLIPRFAPLEAWLRQYIPEDVIQGISNSTGIGPQISDDDTISNAGDGDKRIHQSALTFEKQRNP